MNLLHLCRAQDDRAHVWILRAPGQGQLRGVAAEPLRHRGQLAHLLNLGLALGLLQALGRVGEELGVVGEAAALGHAVVVLARQQARRERAPDGGAVRELLVQRRVLDLEAVPVEAVVLRLLHDGRDQVAGLGDLGRFRDLRCRPLGRAPVVGQVEVADDLGEGFDDFLHRCAVRKMILVCRCGGGEGGYLEGHLRRIRPVCKDDVDVVHVEPL